MPNNVFNLNDVLHKAEQNTPTKNLKALPFSTCTDEEKLSI